MKFLSKKQVLALVPYSYTHIQRLIQAGHFPKPVKHMAYGRSDPSKCKVFWVEDEIQDWMYSLADSR